MMYNVMNSMYKMMTTATDEVDKKYSVEIDKLEKGLIELGVPYRRRELFDGFQIICDGWDAICHCGSYGGSVGLLEIMGIIVQNDDDDVEGYLTAEDILARLS